MNYLQERPTDPRDTSRLPGEVHGLLCAFFRAEMPEPWPEMKSPAGQPPGQSNPPHSRSSLTRSRGVLAASVLLLFTGYWCVSGMHSDAVPNLVNGDSGNNIATKHTDGWPRRMNFTSHQPFDAPETAPGAGDSK